MLMGYDINLEKDFPHNPNVFEYEREDGGFARGWAKHAKPVPEYFFDCHVHYYGDKDGRILDNITGDEKTAKTLGVKGAMLILQTYGRKWNPSMIAETVMDRFPYFSVKELEQKLKGIEDSFHRWAAYLNYHSPEADLAEELIKMGVCCIKLHNAPLIEDNVTPDIWLGEDWQRVFKAIERNNLAVLFHVTQRLPAANYLGGGRNTYWKTGWEKGTKYTNEDLLQVFLTCCKRYPGIRFIGAHQLHIGWERLGQLFAEYPNLYVDNTVGCQLRLYDEFYPHDKTYLRDVFIKHADRLLFGTDTFWGKPAVDVDTNVTYQQHIRFLMKLDLPQEALDSICHKNSERLLNIM
jgi:hypothetical protein